MANFLILMQLGAKHVESPFIEFGQISTVLYFLYFTVVMYGVTTFENSFTDLSLYNNSIKTSSNNGDESTTNAFSSEIFESPYLTGVLLKS
ncbi:MAG: hypothetical protein EOP34_02170 [Rickettsiales bacterium]|nr:MAG: hypothetical protein EOP34_02170 [Rickettsiales bacterium]